MQNLEIEIAEFQKRLNSAEVLPPQAFRRDKFNYAFVSYVNNVTGCYLSNNFKPIPVFIERALNNTEYSGTDCAEYKQLAFEYFKLIVTHLLNSGSIQKENAKDIMELLSEFT